MCVASIATIEIPRGEWDDIIDTLSANVDHQEFNIRHSSLQTLGFICEELRLDQIKQDFRDIIISSLISGIEKNWETTALVEIGI